jgi:hypothetical protein
VVFIWSGCVQRIKITVSCAPWHGSRFGGAGRLNLLCTTHAPCSSLLSRPLKTQYFNYKRKLLKFEDVSLKLNIPAIFLFFIFCLKVNSVMRRLSWISVYPFLLLYSSMYCDLDLWLAQMSAGTLAMLTEDITSSRPIDSVDLSSHKTFQNGSFMRPKIPKLVPCAFVQAKVGSFNQAYNNTASASLQESAFKKKAVKYANGNFAL